MSSVHFNTEIATIDKPAIAEIMESTGFFYDFETKVAVSLVDDTLAEGSATTYRWIKAINESGIIIGFACFGLNPVSTHSWDLYWIAVEKKASGQGLGSQLLNEVEKTVKKEGGKYLWIETSSRLLYHPTRAFYMRKGYETAATLHEFYGENDSKVIFMRKV